MKDMESRRTSLTENPEAWIAIGVVSTLLLCSILSCTYSEALYLKYIPRTTPMQSNIENITLIGIQTGVHSENWRMTSIGAGCINNTHQFSIGIYSASSAIDADYPEMTESEINTIARLNIASCP